MNAITCCCAPAPIDSIATTAATPKIMPEHRQQRSQLVRAQVVEAHAEIGQEVGIRAARAAAAATLNAAPPPAGTAALRCAGLSSVRAMLGSTSAISVPSVQPRDHDAALGALLDLDVARLEALVRPSRTRGSCRSCRTRPDAARESRSARPCRRASRAHDTPGLQPWIGLLELEGDVEQPRCARRLARSSAAIGQAGELADLRRELLARQARRLRRPPRWPATRLGRSLSSILARTSIRPDSITSTTGRPGQYLIARAILRQDHAPEDHAAGRVAVLLDGDDAIKRRA